VGWKYNHFLSIPKRRGDKGAHLLTEQPAVRGPWQMAPL
jgi:hypothetical protein